MSRMSHLSRLALIAVIIPVSVILTFAIVVHNTATVNQLQHSVSSIAADVSDGACVFPKYSGVDFSVLRLFNPLTKYFVPRSSRAFYRTMYELLHEGNTASTEGQLGALRPRPQFFTPRALMALGDIEISFIGLVEGSSSNIWYGYRCLPTMVSDPFLNITCTLIGGESAKGTAISTTQIDTIYLTFLWNDATALNVWGCFRGEQNWHILSKTPVLTPEQIEANDKVLRAHGLDPTHAMNLKYT